MNTKQDKIYELITHIDSCMNFVIANPEKAAFYAGEAKRDLVKIIQLEIEIAVEEKEEAQEKLAGHAAIGVRA